MNAQVTKTIAHTVIAAGSHMPQSSLVRVTPWRARYLVHAISKPASRGAAQGVTTAEIMGTAPP
jgi:hypothetical protein